MYDEGSGLQNTRFGQWTTVVPERQEQSVGSHKESSACTLREYTGNHIELSLGVEDGELKGDQGAEGGSHSLEDMG